MIHSSNGLSYDPEARYCIDCIVGRSFAGLFCGSIRHDAPNQQVPIHWEELAPAPFREA